MSGWKVVLTDLRSAIWCVSTTVWLGTLAFVYCEDIVTSSNVSSNYSDSALEQVYHSLPEKDRRIVDTLNADQRRRVLTQFKLMEVMDRLVEKGRRAIDSEGAETRVIHIMPTNVCMDIDNRSVDQRIGNPPPWVTVVFGKNLSSLDWQKHDRLLRQASECERSLPRTGQREIAVKLWKDVLNAFPDTPFGAEILTHVGDLFDTEQQTREEEGKEWMLRKQYYEQALQLLGWKYMLAGDHAIHTLAFMPGAPLEFMKKVYEWDRQLATGATAQDIWPINSVQCYLEGGPMYLDMRNLQMQAERVVERMKQRVEEVTAKNVFRRSSQCRWALEDLARSYPNEPLGMAAKERLRHAEQQKSIDEHFKGAEKDLAAPKTGIDATPRVQTVTFDKTVPSRTKVVWGTPWRLALVGMGSVLVVGGIVAFVRRRVGKA